MAARQRLRRARTTSAGQAPHQRGLARPRPRPRNCWPV